jgi:hypothetical protein
MRTRTLLAASCILLFGSLMLLVLDGCGGSGGTSSSTSGSTQITNSTLSSLKVETLIPLQMESKNSYLITVSLLPATGQVDVSQVLGEKATVITAHPTPIGTPDIALQQAFGPGYEPYARATLGATTFDVQPNSLLQQSLKQKVVEWTWNLTPQNAGSQQVIGVDIVLEWVPTSSQNPGLPPPEYTIANPQFFVDVSNPSIEFNPIDIGALLTTAAGTLLVGLIGFCVHWTGKWMVKRKREQTSVKTGQAAAQAVNMPTKTVNEPPAGTTGQGS